MAEGSFQEKTEKATPRRREEARKHGQVARSREVSAVLVLLAGFSALYLFRFYISGSIKEMMFYFLGQGLTFQLDKDSILPLGLLCGRYILLVTVPVILPIVIVAILANYVQVGAMFSTEALQPKFSHISPASGLKRLFSRRAIMELGKSVAKLLIIGFMAYRIIKQELPNVLPLINEETGEIIAYISSVSLRILFHTCLVMLILAAIDYAFQRWEFERSLKMTKEEIKQEYKQTEGDPLVKGRLRSIQRERARRRMIAAVPKADVVITNPTHLAVAIQYRAGEVDAPELVAKGAGAVAEKIKEIAMQNNVPLVENKPLAQVIYKTVEIGEMIPPELYQAVAEVLAYVYRLKNKGFAAKQE